ncbi:MAG: CopD family protein [Pontixanthobacter sp.]
MQELLAPIYLWLKAGHIIFVIFWMAGLFMLPRFFVYHQEALARDADGESEVADWIDREAKLRKIILLPAIIAVWVLGLLLMITVGAHTQGWFHAKLVFVLLLSGYHGWLIAYGKKLARGEQGLTGKKLRLANEVPGVATAIIVTLAIVKPF